MQPSVARSSLVQPANASFPAASQPQKQPTVILLHGLLRNAKCMEKLERQAFCLHDDLAERHFHLAV